MSKHHIEVSSVALVDLKAEISRRQIEVKAKAQQLPEGCRVIKSSNPSAQKNSIWKRPQSDSVQSVVDADFIEDEDAKQLEHSRKTLEAKAKLYEALKAAAMSGNSSYSKSRLDTDNDDAPLVDFEQKAFEEAELRRSPVRSCSISSDDESDPVDDEDNYRTTCAEDEWEDYLDEYGTQRTRMVKDKPSHLNDEPPPRPDGPLTYAHLREGEIRDHGVGFYAFSEDAEQREAEMARLRELHRATEEGRARAQATRVKRDARMGQRLARLRARKGLPDVATAAAQVVEASAPPTPLPVSSDTQSDIRLGNEDLDVASMLRRLRDEAEFRAASSNLVPTSIPPPKQPKMQPTYLADVAASQNRPTSYQQSREWDRGKSMLSADLYIQNERVKRFPEFAPPSFY